MNKWVLLVALAFVVIIGCLTGIAEPGLVDPDGGTVVLPDGNVVLMDGGPVPDAGTPDAGTPDAGVPEADSGSPYGLDLRPANPTCIAPVQPPTTTAPVAWAPAFTNLTFTFPMMMLNAPGENGAFAYVVERAGIIKRFPNRANATAAEITTFLTLTVSVQGEGGLLGVAFHPNYAVNREVYVSYTAAGPGGGTPLISRISRFKEVGGALGGEQILLSLNQPYDNHNGGGIAFGPDGFLYIGFGDGGFQDDPLDAGQNPSTLLGKFLRIDVNGTDADAGLQYRIPADNPFLNTPGARREVYAMGVRNPWRWSFDRGTGDLWVGDVGQGFAEEIDKLVRGGNYGWDVREGFNCRGGGTGCPSAGYIDPVVAHPRGEAQSITGGFVYRGTAIPSFIGKYIYGDYILKNIWVLEFESSTDGGANLRPVPTIIGSGGDNIVSFAQLDDGEVYVLRQGGVIQKLVPSGAPPVDSFPKQLSQTGCFEPGDPTRPVAGLIPYDLNAALWSDGAQKERFLALPDAAKISVAPSGDFDFPNGSVLAKTFFLDGKRVETRLFMRHPNGNWAGYSFEWNEAETDATLLVGSKTKQVGARTWYFPSRSECLVCHTAPAGFTLGLEVGQLNRTFQYPSTARTRNQLSTLESIGLFSAPLGGTPDTLIRYESPSGAGPVAHRAQAYLHANCAGCHRPNGTGRGPQNFVYGADGGVGTYCNVNPSNGNLGIANAKILAPGSPSTSILSRRMHALDANRMPPLASRVADTDGMNVVDSWIQTLSTCP